MAPPTGWSYPIRPRIALGEAVPARNRRGQKPLGLRPKLSITKQGFSPCSQVLRYFDLSID